MEPLLGTFAVAALGGLTWLAYEHPKEFGQLSIVLGWLCFVGIAGILLWNSAVTQTILLAIKAAPHDYDAVADVSAKVKVELGAKQLAALIGLSVYMCFLWLFVSHLKGKGEREMNDRKHDK